jgi:excinuclease UvrABC helicase subunit UvrB
VTSLVCRCRTRTVTSIGFEIWEQEFQIPSSYGRKAFTGQMFSESGVHVLLDSVLDGYSACVFAYGQTGSGKTYTMAGIEENLGKQDYVSNETDGIIPRSISYMWQNMTRRKEQYYVKAAFLEIYNEQIKDLLKSN